MLEFRNINNSQSDIEQRKSKIKQDIQLLIENGYYAEAQSSIESYLEVEPDDFEIYSIHAVLLIYQGELDAAERVLNQGLLYNEYDPDLLFNKSWLMEQKGDIALAKYYYGRALTYCRDTEIKNQLKEKLSIPVTTNEQPYVLIGSPVHQDYEILKKFLKSLSLVLLL